MILGTQAEGIELSVIEVQPEIAGYTPGGDVRVRVRVWDGGFAGCVETWVPAETWAAFHDRLIELERTRQGDAALESTSPGDLRLRVAATDQRGHVAVEGALRHRSAASSSTVELGFGALEVDPTLLPGLIAELTQAVRAHKGGSQ